MTTDKYNPAKYSDQELVGIAFKIDRNEYPERFEKVMVELKQRGINITQEQFEDGPINSIKADWMALKMIPLLIFGGIAALVLLVKLMAFLIAQFRQ